MDPDPRSNTGVGRMTGVVLIVLAFLAFAASRIGVPTQGADCRGCPEMVEIPAGTFRMGGLPGDRQAAEQPAHEVNVQAFAISRYEVTFGQWDRCVADGVCARGIIDQGWGRGAVPAFNVSWDDVQHYVRWLSKESGHRYRLPTEAEWEYAARAGSAGRYAWGSEIEAGRAVCYSECGPEADRPAMGGTTAPNAWGLYDLHGNLWEWTQDCWHANFDGAPTDGSAWEGADKCEARTIRGGSWNSLPFDIRTSVRAAMAHDMQYNTVGFRVVRASSSADAQPSPSTSMPPNEKPSRDAEVHFVDGPLVAETPTLLVWLRAQQDTRRQLRLPVTLAMAQGGGSPREGQVGNVGIALSDSALGVSLADRVRSACGAAAKKKCTLWLEGYWNGTRLDLRKVGPRVTETSPHAGVQADHRSGHAVNAKAGAALTAHENEVIYLDGLAAWPDGVAGRTVEVSGLLVTRQVVPDATVDAGGAISAGASGSQRVFESPRWSLVE